MRASRQMFNVRRGLFQLVITAAVALSLWLSGGLLTAAPATDASQGADGLQHLAGPSHDGGGG